MSTWIPPQSGWYEFPSGRELTPAEVADIEQHNWEPPVTSAPGAVCAQFSHGKVWAAAWNKVTLPNGQKVPGMTWAEVTQPVPVAPGEDW